MEQKPNAPPAYSVTVVSGPVPVQAPPTQPERTNEKSTGFLVTMNVINSLTHMLLGSISILALFMANKFDRTPFKAHVYLSVFGYVILMTQAVLTFNPYNNWSSNIKYPHKRKLHYVMQICGSILAIAGGAQGMANVNFNLRSTHGVFGFMAMVLTVVSLLGGLYHLCFPTKMRSTFLKKSHACVGVLTLTSAYIALALAFDNSRSIFTLDDTTADLAIASTVFALAGILLVSGGRVFTRYFDK